MSGLGERLRSVRKRRGVTQRELARLSGVSLSLVRKLEQGEREDTRLETLRRLAAALQVPTAALIVRKADAGERSARWGALRAALDGTPASGPDDEPSAREVGATLRALMPLFSGDRYAELADLLPPLLRSADELGQDGHRVRARLLHHTGWLLTQTRQFDAAETALSRALEESDDPLDRAAIINTRCWLLMRQGDLGGATALATRWADEVEPRMSRATAADLSAWGWLLVRLSTAAIRNNQPGDAEDAIRLARTAAVAMGGEFAPPGDFLRAFGPMTVAMKAAENAMVENRPDRVLSIAERVPLGDLRPTSNNRNRHLLDVAKARVLLRQYPQAIDLLMGIRRDAPEWITNQRYARDILSEIIAKRRTLTTDMRDLADYLDLSP
ncbi:helix-turn-helix domain-containing protein [Actinocorallia sp. API 0066]|uniref:helix-turn-helix domain-containing protein n=1 Tax=Actinocorallia sp. API 0066 TaxID=2896846 RepID=UPI001E40A736|nr:helix-turn-helix domain-containing protein [Actinocorallia sp. API 0066]MCD0452186.1 helix-turn-helix domain-containing protein [Actinocorallia sp. API 0066]